MYTYLKFMLITAVLLHGPAALSGEMVHQFVDPGFGGSPLNSSYVLGEASAQDQTKNPSAASNGISPSAGIGAFNPATQSFADLIQQGLQQQLADKIINSVLGNSPTPLATGSYIFGNNKVNIGKDASGETVVTIIDPSGHSTQIVIPNY